MRKYVFEHDGVTYQRVTKSKAKKAYETDTILLCPCNMRPLGEWGIGVWVTNNGKPFESVVNEFEFYNCNSETGNYAAFFIPYHEDAF